MKQRATKNRINFWTNATRCPAAATTILLMEVLKCFLKRAGWRDLFGSRVKRILSYRPKNTHKHSTRGPSSGSRFVLCCLLEAGVEKKYLWMERASREEVLLPSRGPEPGCYPGGVHGPSDDTLQVMSSHPNAQFCSNLDAFPLNLPTENSFPSPRSRIFEKPKQRAEKHQKRQRELQS